MTPHDIPDPHLSMLTVPQAVYLRELTADFFFTRHGVRPAVEGDVVEHAGRLSPLKNLAQRCRAVGEEQWPALVEQHFGNLETASRGEESTQELLRAAYPRLLPDDFFPADAASGFRYVQPVAEGLILAFALDAPASVRILTDRDVAGAGHRELWTAGVANLRRDPVEHVEVRGPQGALLHSVSGGSHFVASRALVLPDLVRSVTGRELPAAGALVAVPTRHLLAFHAIVDGTVVDAVNDLGAYALGAYEDGPGSLSPRLYWWHQGQLVSLTVFDHDRRTFSVVPPQELMELMRNLRDRDGGGGSAPEVAGGRTDVEQPEPATVEQLALTVAEFTARLEQDASGFADGFGAAVDLAHARCADDAASAKLETWEAWVTAMQVGSALFATALAREGTVPCRIGDRVLALPGTATATGIAPYAHARAWLDAFWLAVVCREQERITTLCRVPVENLRSADPVDDYVLHWIDTLQSYWLGRPMDDIVQKLVATMNTSGRDVATRTPRDFLDLIDYQPVALFHRLVTKDHAAFAEALTEALAHHDTYWNGSRAPRGRVALGPLAMACLAYEMGFPVDVDKTLPYLPKYLLNREWLGEFTT
ncbi:immunity 49 family protein [Embleya sp. NPDC050154]|uniref:immunity 49 family protein n=1 Tax=Embleya sp. NPDC050154 TaxID=3363988 RepID=UPI0037B17CE4